MANLTVKLEPPTEALLPAPVHQPPTAQEEFFRGIRVARYFRSLRPMTNFAYLPVLDRAYMCGWNIGVIQNLQDAQQSAQEFSSFADAKLSKIPPLAEVVNG